MKSILILASLLNIASVFADNCNPPFYQCGGSNWKGLKCCSSGYTCKQINMWYSQCVPSNTVNNNNNNSNVNYYNTNNKANINKNNNNKNKANNNNNKNNNKNNKNNNNTNKNNNNSNNNNNNVQYASSNASASSSLIGYASLNGGTKGGQGGQVINVSNQNQLVNALKGNNSKIVRVNGIINLNTDINVGSNTSIIGANGNSGFTGGGFKFKNAKNIIFQNLKFSYCLGPNKDCINAQKSSNIWVDHCEFFNDRNHGKDYYDGLIDFTHACDYITISYNYIHDHYKASLIGHSDNNGAEDTGKLHITYHHNYFKNVGSRLPSLRFGTAHVFNNVYENIEASSVNIRMGAQALIEANVFKNANKPISTNLDSKQEGYVVQRNNNFGNTANTNSITKIGNLNTVPYKYNSDNVQNVYNIVVRSAGPK
ncbi:pectin lyase-like protein [Neocallimastix sp. 'constans']